MRQRSPRGAQAYRRAMLVLAAVSSRNTSRSGSKSSWPANQASRAALTSSRSCSAACMPLFPADAMTGQKARETAGADRNPFLLERVAQLAQEDLRTSLVGLQDERGMSLDVAGALVAPQGRGSDVPLALLLLRPAADAGAAHPKALGSLAAGCPGCHRGHHALAQINGQGCRHRPPPCSVNP